MPHIHEKIDFTTTAIIVCDGRVLLVNHPRYQKWIPPGGHIELDEQPEEAVIREIAEETGLDVELMPDKPRAPIHEDGVNFLLAPNYIDIHDANPPHRHIGLVYFARAKSDAFKLSDEHDDMRWFTPKEMDNPTYNIGASVKFYATEAIKKAEQ